MNSRPLIFVSYSQRYPELKSFFVQLLEDLGFRPEVFDYGSTTNPPETERLLIKKCDGFVGILTPDQETASGPYICSPSVSAEIAMAFAGDKPIQLFAINNVDYTAIPFHETNTILKLNTINTPGSPLAFDANNIRLVFRTIIEFKNKIDSIYEAKLASFDPVLSYKSFEIDQTILSSDDLQLHTNIKAVALKNVDTHTHAARLVCERGAGEGIKLKDHNFNFKLFKPYNCRASVRYGENEYSSYRFYIDFEPAIQADTEITYAFRRRYSNYFPYTLEELEQLINYKKIKSKFMVDNYMVGQDFYVTQPTERVIFSLKFPPRYPIRKYLALASYGKGESIHTIETGRISSLPELIHDQFDDFYTLVLNVPNPHLNLTYYLLYEPPKEENILG